MNSTQHQQSDFTHRLESDILVFLNHSLIEPDFYELSSKIQGNKKYIFHQLIHVKSNFSNFIEISLKPSDLKLKQETGNRFVLYLHTSTSTSCLGGGATWAAPSGGFRASAVMFLGNMVWGRGFGGSSAITGGGESSPSSTSAALGATLGPAGGGGSRGL